MIPAIDAYSYHRYFGHHYPELETVPDTQMTNIGFIERAHAFGASGVSLESCFFSDFSDAQVLPVRQKLDALGMKRVWAWGHPGGLQSGRSKIALEDLVNNIDVAVRIGAGTVRICAGGRGTRPDTWREHRALLLPMLKHAAHVAEDSGVVLAVENHMDLYAAEMLELMEAVDSRSLGVCLDTANNLRMFEDPVEVARMLANWVRATHLKDITARGGDPKTFAFWPSVAIGDGVVDIPRILRILDAAGYEGLLALEIDLLHPRYPSEDAALTLGLANLARMLESIGQEERASDLALP